MDRLKCMQIFVHVVEQGSFAAVADPFGMSAAMVGRHVRSLEDALGEQLLNRTTRRHALTEAGRIYYEKAKSILADIDAADESVALTKSVSRGVLRVGAPVGFGSTCLAPCLHAYLAANPEVQIELTLNNRVLDLMEEGYDLVIRTGDLPDSGLILRALKPYGLVAVASPAYLKQHGAPQHPNDLTMHSCLGFRPGVANETWSFQDKRDKKSVLTVPVSGVLVANDAQTLRHAALNGLGVILQAEAMLEDDLRSGQLVRVIEGFDPKPLPLQMLYSPSRSVTPKLRSFLDFMILHFG